MTTSYFPADGQLFYFWKGRVALYALLKSLDIGPGDEVILPGFTCVVVPNAILYLGAKPIYADIEADTYNLSVATIESLINRRTRLIIAQNSFGLSADLDPIVELATHYGLSVIEDCAHGLGGLYRGRPNGTVARAAFFSTQWSKPISTGLGGVAYTADNDLVKRLQTLTAKLPPPTVSQQAMLQAQLWLRPLADNPRLYYPLVSLYRFLTQKIGLSVGSSTGNELTTITMPAGYLKRMGRYQIRNWQRGLTHLAKKAAHRQAVASLYDQFLATTSIAPAYRPSYATHGMLRYPIRVPDKERLLAKAKALGLPLGDWFVSPLHPVKGDLTQWKYHPGQCPVAEKACRELINLPTTQPFSPAQFKRLFDSVVTVSPRKVANQ